jgi:hypothetical protein
MENHFEQHNPHWDPKIDFLIELNQDPYNHGFKAKPVKTVAIGFETKPVKIVAASFEANPLEVVVTDFETKLVKTI